MIKTIGGWNIITISQESYICPLITAMMSFYKEHDKVTLFKRGEKYKGRFLKRMEIDIKYGFLRES